MKRAKPSKLEPQQNAAAKVTVDNTTYKLSALVTGIRSGDVLVGVLSTNR